MKLLLASLLVLVPLTVHAEYLGDLSANEVNPNSISNDVGPYGSLSPTSPTNPIGVYGSRLLRIASHERKKFARCYVADDDQLAVRVYGLPSTVGRVAIQFR